MHPATVAPPPGTRIRLTQDDGTTSLDVGPLAPWRWVNSGTLVGAFFLAVTLLLFVGVIPEAWSLRPLYKVVLAVTFFLCIGAIGGLIGLFMLLFGLSVPLRRAHFMIRDNTLAITTSPSDPALSIPIADVRDLRIVRESSIFSSGTTTARLRLDAAGRDTLDLLHGRPLSELRWIAAHLRPAIGLTPDALAEPHVVPSRLGNTVADAQPATPSRHTGASALRISAPPLGIRRGTEGRWVVVYLFILPLLLGTAALSVWMCTLLVHEPHLKDRLWAIPALGMSAGTIWALWLCVRQPTLAGRSAAVFHLAHDHLTIVADERGSRVTLSRPVDEIFDIRATSTDQGFGRPLHVISVDGQRTTFLSDRPGEDARRAAVHLTAALSLTSRLTRSHRWFESGSLPIPPAACHWTIDRRPETLRICIPPRPIRTRVGRGALLAAAVLAAVHILGPIAYLAVPAHPVAAAVALCLVGISIVVALPFQYHRQETEIELTPDVLRVTRRSPLRRKEQAWHASAVVDLINEKDGVMIVVGNLRAPLLPSYDPAERAALIAVLGPPLGLFPDAITPVPTAGRAALQHA